MQLVLASQSPYRKAQLTRFGVSFVAENPRVDEDYLKASGPRDPVELTRFLALRKASSLVADFPDAIVIGCDQMAVCDGERLDKPGTRARAVEQLKRLSGREHELVTSIAVLRDGAEIVQSETTRIRLRAWDLAVLEAYVDLDRPLDCAGAYKIEAAGLALIERVSGRDPSAVEGLPLILLTEALVKLGFPPHRFWSSI